MRWDEKKYNLVMLPTILASFFQKILKRGIREKAQKFPLVLPYAPLEP